MPPLATTKDLVTRAAHGDPAAFSSLIAAHERTVLSIAFAITGNDATAADATQDAFIKAWQRLRELNDPLRFPAWLAQITRRCALDARRRNPAPATRDLATLDLPDPSDPSASLEESETRQRIDAALSELDETTRIAVVLRYYDDLPSRQIGDLLDLSPAAVDTRLKRARDALRPKLCPINENRP